VGLISWIANKFGGTIDISKISKEDIEDCVADIYIRELALNSTINLIAGVFCKAEFKTYDNNEEIKKDEYYLWNISPNKNQSATEFKTKLITSLYKNNECLVIVKNNQLWVADDFKQNKNISGDTFTEVKIGDDKIEEVFTQDDVMYFKLFEDNTNKVIKGLYSSYSRLIVYGMKSYRKSRGVKGVFKYKALPVAGSSQREYFDKLIGERFKQYMDSDNAILPLGEGQEFIEKDGKTYSSENTRDIKAMIDDIAEFTAKGFNVPPALTRGDIQGLDEAVELLLTFCISPLFKKVETEINKKRIGKKKWLKGAKLKIDIRQIKHVDILSISTAIDKLIASGCFCVNDVRELVGEEKIDEPWANEHFITKNYGAVNLATEGEKGSEEN